MSATKHSRRMACAIGSLVLGSVLATTASAEGGHGHHPKALPDAFKEVLEDSLRTRKGVMFYVDGQAIPGVVTVIGENGVIEAYNQEHDRIVIRAHRIDALAR